MYAEVLIQYQIKSLDHTYTYKIPDRLLNKISAGSRVCVPFGKSIINGFVLNIKDKSDIETKDIIDVVGDIKLTDELMKLGEYLKNKLLCTKVSIFQAMLPSSLKIDKDKFNYDKYIKYLSLNVSMNEVEEYISNHKRSIKQIEILNEIKNNKHIKYETTSSSIKTLIDEGIIKIEYESVYRINPKNEFKKKELTIDQKNIYDRICMSLNKNEEFLLHGVTGSGKTEIYMELIDTVVKNGKTALCLVPEISLTTQIVKRFYDRFGSNVAIFHSELSDGEKYDEYKKIINGDASIVVGTRSSIFVPLNNLGIIIIDEEHTSSYKQENNPRYNAIDVAKWRCKYNNIPLVLGSATPSFETYARAMKGNITYLKLDKRVGNSKLPSIKIVDMSKEYRKGNNILSEELQIEIMDTIKRGEQVMLLINRRGFSTIETCQNCGYTHKCPNCDITLTYHKTSNNLRCHYCGYTIKNSSICPECKMDAIRDFGMGSEKVEEYVKNLYPSYNVVRMDRDTTIKKGAHDKIIKAIENHEYDIIIGTQMISKGLDFPKVTLVGIVNADDELNIPDFRSGENTYSLLSQVSGRCGRSDLPGNVIIQTFNPDSKTLNYVLKNDYEGNYKYEMNIRKTLKYPPYYYLISIKVTSKDYDEASKESIKIVNYIKKNIESNSICLGPTTASPFKINNIYRFNIIIKYRFDNKLASTLKFLDEQYIMNKNVNFEIDVDPLRI